MDEYQLNTTINNRCIKIVCGNGYLQRGEQCEDGNSYSGDGCSI